MERTSRGRLLLGLCLALVGCEGAGHDAGGGAPGSSVPAYSGAGPVRITCTVGMLADIVAAIGAERVSVTALMGPGTDPHLYQATAGDRRKLGEADVIFYCGHHLEGKMGEVLERLARRVPTLAVCEQVDRARLLGDPLRPDVVDPHLWFDVELWARCAEIVRDHLCGFDPGAADGYRQRATAYLATLAETHRYVLERAAEIPEERRVLVTAHDAFQYFGRAYGFEVLGIQGLSTDSEPAVQRIRELVDVIVERRVSAVFVESTISEKNISSLIEGSRARGHGLRKGGTLYSDAMGAAGTPAGTYVGMVRHNIDTIVGALR